MVVVVAGTVTACGADPPPVADPPTASGPAPATDETAPPAASASSAGPDLFVAVMPEGVVLGDDPLEYHTVPDDGHEDIVGELAAIGGCLVLDGGQRRIPVWPTGTTWNAATGVGWSGNAAYPNFGAGADESKFVMAPEGVTPAITVNPINSL